MKKSLLLLSALAVASGIANAQTLREGYITWPSSQELGTYVKAWNGGSGKITIGGKEWEDEEFFTSRVKPRARFNETRTQIYADRLAYNMSTKTGTDKRVCYWAPINDEKRNGVQANGLPDAIFDSEVFNMWSYIDNYGDWNAPYGWTPGAFADAAHKNGVGVHGVASVPFGSCSSEWVSAFNSLTSNSIDNIYKFLNYHGQDGFGYNSEWSGGYNPSPLYTMHNSLATKMAGNPVWEVMWYGGTTDSGSRSFDSGVGSSGGNTKIFENASIFLNYNWDNGYKQSSVDHAKSVGRNPFYIYTGNNTQGGEGGYYSSLMNYQMSVGLWTGHNVNTIWKARQSKGSSAITKMSTYLHDNEMLFGNGKRNPAIKMTVKNHPSSGPDPDFAGMSAMKNAASTITHTIKDEPFITYFNLGNGMFFNYEGVRQNDAQWYNIGVQDYLPTWHYWLAPTYKQTEVTEGTTNLNVDACYDDAYFGGSCLKVEGTTTQEYLHLFKTQITPANGQYLTIRYKLLEGSGDVRVVIAGTDGVEGTKFTTNETTLFSTATSADVQDQSYKVGKDGWVTYQLKLATARLNYLTDKKIGMISLEVKNAKNMKLLLGELSITPASGLTTPGTPVIKSSKVFTNNFKGVDAKLIWTMDGDAGRNAGTPVYNSDVNASLYRVWTQQQGEEPVNMGVTGQWASIIYQAPFNQKGVAKMRVGVSAVSTDFKSESAIAWSSYMDVPTYEINPEIAISKNVIKPNEDFELSFVDDEMPSATWKITNCATGQVSWTGSGHSVKCDGLADIGAYDLEITYTRNGSTVTKTYPCYVPITSWSVGALPMIYKVTYDGDDVTNANAEIRINKGENHTFAYEGRYADGIGSRGLDLNEKWFGVQCGNLSLQAHKSFTVAAWVRFDELPEGCSNFITIEDRVSGGWPYNNWGYFWSRINGEGGFTANRVDGAWGGRTVGRGTEDRRFYYTHGDAKIYPGVWTHIAVTFDYDDPQGRSGFMRQKFYINGAQQKLTYGIEVNKGSFQTAVGGEDGDWWNLSLGKSIANYYTENTYEPTYLDKSSWPITSSMWISFGGSAPNVNAVKGSLDDFQIWNKVMTADEIQMSRNGLDKNNLPAGCIAFWDFEDDRTADGAFTGSACTGASNQSPKGYFYDIPSQGENSNQRTFNAPNFLSGCPFLNGTAYPIVTKAKWNTRAELVESSSKATSSRATTINEGEAGSATFNFPRSNDYEVELTLENGHGTASKYFPVISAIEITAIDGVNEDLDQLKAYTTDGLLFIDFPEDGNYEVAVYNVSGMLGAREDINAVAGQRASISLGAKGVYLVKIVKDGAEIRTVKVINK